MNLNYPDYNKSMGGYGTYQPNPPQDPNVMGNMAGGAASGAGAGAAFGPYGALIGSLAGTALGAYGSYQQGNQADADYERALKAYEEEKARGQKMDQQSQQQQQLNNIHGAGNYAQGITKSAYGSYDPWARGGL
jgi:hypothetical protein